MAKASSPLPDDLKAVTPGFLVRLKNASDRAPAIGPVERYHDAYLAAFGAGHFGHIAENTEYLEGLLEVATDPSYNRDLRWTAMHILHNIFYWHGPEIDARIVNASVAQIREGGDLAYSAMQYLALNLASYHRDCQSLTGTLREIVTGADFRTLIDTMSTKGGHSDWRVEKEAKRIQAYLNAPTPAQAPRVSL